MRSRQTTKRFLQTFIPESVTKEGKQAARAQQLRSQVAANESVWAQPAAASQQEQNSRPRGCLAAVTACARVLKEALMNVRAIRYTVTVCSHPTKKIASHPTFLTVEVCVRR